MLKPTQRFQQSFEDELLFTSNVGYANVLDSMNNYCSYRFVFLQS